MSRKSGNRFSEKGHAPLSKDFSGSTGKLALSKSALRRRDLAQPLDDVGWRPGIDTGEQRLELLAAARRVDAEPALVRVRHELGFLERVEERRLHGGDAI